MSEQAKTVGGRALALVQHGGYTQKEFDAFFHIAHGLGILDYHIIPGTECVAAGLEDAARLLHRLFSTALVICWEEVPEKEKEDWFARARAALEAAGIKVVNEVYRGVVVTGSEVGPCARCDRWDVPVEPLDIADGDTIFIQRATTGKEE